MKKISFVCFLLAFAILYTSCKKDDSASSESPIDLARTEVKKVMPLFSEATVLFNAGNGSIASIKAEQAKMLLNSLFIPGRRFVISSDCPITYLKSDDTMMIFALACGDFINKQPAVTKGTFEEHMILFNVSYKQEGSAAGAVTSKEIADKIKAAPYGANFTATLLIMDPGVLMEAEEEFLSSYSMSYNVKVLDIEKSGK